MTAYYEKLAKQEFGTWKDKRDLILECIAKIDNWPKYSTAAINAKAILKHIRK